MNIWKSGSKHKCFGINPNNQDNNEKRRVFTSFAAENELCKRY